MAFPQSVERWRSRAERFSAIAPTDYLLDWIRTESGGNRCNLTTSAGFPEVGLFQLDPGNAATAGTSHEVLRRGCSGQQDVDPSDENLDTAMQTGVDYVNRVKAATHARLRDVGTDWEESDPGFWALVRLTFSAGTGAVTSWLRTAAQSLGRGPIDWDEFVSASGASGNHWVSVAADNALNAVGWQPPGLFGGGRGLVWLAGIFGVIGGAVLFERRAFRRFGL